MYLLSLTDIYLMARPNVVKTSISIGVMLTSLVGAGVTPGFAAVEPAYSYAGPVPLPEAGALLGAYVTSNAHNGTDRRSAWTNFEALVQRPMDIDRKFFDWSAPFPTVDDEWSRDQGRTLYISWNAEPNDGSGCARWAHIAAGLYDAEIDARAAAIKAFAAPLFFSFHHEPTTPTNGETCGTPNEFIAAWRHIHDRFELKGVTNATYALTLMAGTFQQGRGDLFYPGDDYVDVIAADGYNWYGCEHQPGPWREFDQIFQSFYDFGVAKGKPMVVAEYGTGEDPEVEGKKAQWFANAADTLKDWPLIKAVSYFDVARTCTRFVDSSPSSLEAFRNLGADPYFNPPVPTTEVSVSDSAFSPDRVGTVQGGRFLWSFNGPGAHTVTDASGMGLYDSGPLSLGSRFSFSYIAAGRYPYVCSIHPSSMTGGVGVPVVVSPASGGRSTTFTITWGANRAPSGHTFDVQIRRPGRGWVSWRTSQIVKETIFTPDAGNGTYSFRARYRNTVNGAASAWSFAESITVG